MKKRHVELKALGWKNWFDQRSECMQEDNIVRVAAVDRDQLWLINQTGTFRAKLAGSFLFHHTLSSELPCIGGWVCVGRYPGDNFGLIHLLLERRTMLRRAWIA